MIVRIGLKAGGVITDSTQQVCNTCNASIGIIAKAEQEADQVVGSITASAKTLSNCIQKTFG